MGIHTFKIGENRGPTVKLKSVKILSMVSIFYTKVIKMPEQRICLAKLTALLPLKAK
jgi:hypothetical protein